MSQFSLWYSNGETKCEKCEVSGSVFSSEMAAMTAAHSSQLRKHEKYRSRFLPGTRDLIVYLPAMYDKNPRAHFPVLYLQDGQNLFDGTTSFIPGMDWHIRETADHLIAQGAIQPLVIVGIYNTGKRRLGEYTPSRDKKLGGGKADRYGRMLIEEIKPFIESEYRVLGGPAHTGLGGSSLGGLLTIYLGLRFPHIFGKLAVLSPSVWWNRGWILNFVAHASGPARPHIWLDTGTDEGGRSMENVKKLRDVLVQGGWRQGRDLHFEEIPGAHHNEAAWAQRVGPFLQFLFPSRETEV
jgi:enterochelin esterase-like enzyme